VRTDPLVGVPGYESWGDVPVAEVSTVESVQQARAAYEAAVAQVHPHLKPTE
jgi:3D-(3,5/4)-trihydroxycyclohexane-1,2-dione acylhydrolase (decyclizing)